MGSDEGNGRHIPQLGVVFLVGNDGSGKTMLSTSLSFGPVFDRIHAELTSVDLLVVCKKKKKLDIF